MGWWKRYTLLNIPKDYSGNHIKKDLFAGLTMLIMIIPQGMAYASLAGLPPVMGLYASLFPLSIYALFGTSTKFAIGPVAMASILVFSGVSTYAEPNTETYISMVLFLTLMVGTIQLLMGIFNAAALLKFISPNVIGGFTAAVAISIAMSQLGSLLGINISNQTRLLPLLEDIVKHLPSLHLPTLGLGLSSLVLLTGARWLSVRWPISLLVVIAGISITAIFRLDTIGVRIVGSVPQGLPSPMIPFTSIVDFQFILPIALTIALISMMEILAIHSALSERKEEKINLNQEIRAIGISNFVGSFFASYTVTGSFSRSAVNARTGAVSKLAMVITIVGVLLTLLFFTSAFYFLPFTVLASIILVSVSGLIKLQPLRESLKIKPEDGWVWLITFLATLLVGIQWGLLLGIGFSTLLLLRHVAKPNIVEMGFEEESQSYRDLQRFPRAKKDRRMVLIRVDTRIHFSNIEYLSKIIDNKVKQRKKLDNNSHIIIDMSGVNDIDSPGMEGLEQILQKYQKDNKNCIKLVELKGPVRDILSRAGWTKRYPEALVYSSLENFLIYENIKENHQKSREDNPDPWDFMI